MTPENRGRLLLELHNHKGPLKKPADLLRRAASSEDVADTAVIGGVALADVVAGKIAEAQIPPNVIEAFHAQYPQYGTSFIEAVQRLSKDPEKLSGLVNGVKGKVLVKQWSSARWFDGRTFASCE